MKAFLSDYSTSNAAVPLGLSPSRNASLAEYITSSLGTNKLASLFKFQLTKSYKEGTKSRYLDSYLQNLNKLENKTQLKLRKLELRRSTESPAMRSPNSYMMHTKASSVASFSNSKQFRIRVKT
jgi:hypothetical protein